MKYVILYKNPLELEESVLLNDTLIQNNLMKCYKLLEKI